MKNPSKSHGSPHQITARNENQVAPMNQIPHPLVPRRKSQAKRGEKKTERKISRSRRAKPK
uniref:Uncharacterized protein n=1 Tax=Arundo donax TaxID=35708 RepID=A0A0A9H3W5_ARUDO